MNSEPRRKGHTPLLTDRLRTEADARSCLRRMRWPNGIVCPGLDNCGGSGAYRITVAGKTLKERGALSARARVVQMQGVQAPVQRDEGDDLRGRQDSAANLASRQMYRMGVEQEGRECSPDGERVWPDAREERGTCSTASGSP